MQMEQSQQQRYCLSFLISKLRQQTATMEGGKRCGAKPAVDSRQPTSNFRVLPPYLRGCHGCQAGVCALLPLPLTPPEWLLIKNKHDFCFAFIFYYKPASPAPTRPAQHQPHLPFSRPGLLEKR